MTMLPSSTPSSTPSPSNCAKCRGIRTMISQKFCPACGKPLLELPQPQCQATATDTKNSVHELEHWRCEAKNWRDMAEKLQQDTDFFHRVFGKRFHLDSVCGSCGGPLDCERDAICRRCTDAGPAEEEKAADAIADKLQNLRGPDGLFHEGVWNPVTERYDMAPSTGETFTPAQMVAAIGHWLSFGERMLAMNQQGGYFSGCGWAARALAAAREFIQKAGAE